MFNLIFRTWAVEICASITSIIALVAIFVTLQSHNGRPLPDWPLGITINSLVSIFSVIFKSAMLLGVAEGEFASFTFSFTVVLTDHAQLSAS